MSSSQYFFNTKIYDIYDFNVMRILLQFDVSSLNNEKDIVFYYEKKINSCIFLFTFRCLNPQMTNNFKKV